MAYSQIIVGASFSQYFATIVNYINFSTLSSNVTKTANGGGGYNYAFSNGGSGSYANNSDMFLNANVNGQYWAKNTAINLQSAGASGLSALSLQNTNTVTTTPLVAGAFGVYFSFVSGSGSTALYNVLVFDGTTSGITPNITTFSFTGSTGNKWLRLRRNTGIIFAEASTDGITWTTLHQFPTANNSVLYPLLSVSGTSSSSTFQQPQM